MKMLVHCTNQFHKKGRKETHYALSENSDLSICGCDLAGDDDYIGLGLTPNRKVDCQDCLVLYKAVIAHFQLS